MTPEDLSRLKLRKLRAKLSWDGKVWYVKLPHYVMVPNTFEPVTEGLIHEDGVLPNVDVDKVLQLEPTVEVEVPERILDLDTGRPSNAKIRALYQGNELWDHEQAGEDV